VLVPVFKAGWQAALRLLTRLRNKKFFPDENHHFVLEKKNELVQFMSAFNNPS
jgi:hypothetical protein